jgi:hypothetical protein
MPLVTVDTLSRSRMKRVSALSAVLLAVLALPTAAMAAGDDPLLSGYGGPGSGDQAVLGGGLVGGGGGASGSYGAGGSGSLRAVTPNAPASTATQSSGAGDSGTTASPSATPGRHTSSGSGRHHGTKHQDATAPTAPAPSSTASTPTAATATTDLPRLSTVPASAERSSAGGLPLSTSDLLLALVVALAIAALAVATRRLSRDFAGPSDLAV